MAETGRREETDAGDNVADRALVSRAVDGDREARGRITQLVDPIIKYQNQRLCRKYCHGNFRVYQCTVQVDYKYPAGGGPLCEWGNAGYAWMLEDLTRDQRLQRYDGRNGAGLKDYLFQIANSLPFYERWKDWRFGRRIHVPVYLRDLAPLADRVYYGLVDGDTPALIAQRLGRAEAEIQTLAQQIIMELARRNRLHLLDPPRTLSLTGLHAPDDDEAAGEADIAAWDPAVEDVEMQERLRTAWERLSAVEQFVLEAMLVEETDANEVLAALQRLGLSLQEDAAERAPDRQQLYYFRRKTLAKLTRMVQGDED